LKKPFSQFLNIISYKSDKAKRISSSFKDKIKADEVIILEKFTIVFSKLSFFLLLSLIPLWVQAIPPPYIAFRTGENLFFEGKKCGQIAKQVLEEDGFQRVSPSGENDILAAFKKTTKYQYKALISCLPKYGIVRVVIVTEFSGQGADKANKLLADIERYLKAGNSAKSIIDPKGKGLQKGEQDFQKGNQYYDGRNVLQDFRQALQWYQKAAEQGHYEAQYKLGMMYYEGQHIPQDFMKAYMWLLLASAHGKKEAVETRDKAIAQLSPKQIDEAQQMARQLYAGYNATQGM
jgi:hypothetical protein